MSAGKLKQYRVVIGGKPQRSYRAGAYAGSRSDRIFGRLDCPSSRVKLRRANRVFFLDWDDAVGSGYRPCQVCRPDVPRTGDHLPIGHPALGAMHVALWDTNPRPFPRRPQVCFYSAVSWEELDREAHTATSHQITLAPWMPRPQANQRAISWGRRLGLPVIDYWRSGSRVLWAPDGEPTPDQLKSRAAVLRRRRTSLTGPTMRA